MESGRHARRGWSVARLLQEGYPHMRFRRSVLTDRVLGATLDDILRAENGLADFVESLAAVPGCGARQRGSIQAALMTEIRIQAEIAARRGDMPLARRFASRIEILPSGDVATTEGAPVQFHAGAMVEDVCAELWRNTRAWRFIYLPQTLPDTAKTAAVMACEGRVADAAERVPFWAAARDGRDPGDQAQGLILIDRQHLDAIRARSGPYAALSEAASQDQLSRLAGFCATLPPGIAAKVVDYLKTRLAAGAIVGSGLVLPAQGGCVLWQHGAAIEDVVASCEVAQESGQDLASLLPR